jgi:hypothetical protein
VETGAGLARARLRNVAADSKGFGLTKEVALMYGQTALQVNYSLPPTLDELTVELGLSPDYLKLLRYGRNALQEYARPEGRGCATREVAVWIRPSACDPVWQETEEENFAHKRSFKLTVNARQFAIEVGVDLPGELEKVISVEPEHVARKRPRAELASLELVFNLLQAQMPGAYGDWVPDLHRSQVVVLKNRVPSRYACCYQFQLRHSKSGASQELHVVAKRYSDPNVGAGEFEALQKLWEAGFAAGERYAIPKPLLYSRESRLMLQEKATGVQLRNSIGKLGGLRWLRVRGAARWLAKLHSLQTTGATSSNHELNSLERFVEQLSAADPKLRRRLRHFAERIRTTVRSFGSIRARLIHGDYHPENILVSRHGVTVLDFERTALADPAKDIGYFIAQTWIMGCASRRSKEAIVLQIRGFLTEYFRYTGASIQDLSARITVAVECAFLEAMYYALCVLNVSEPGAVSAWVAELTAFDRGEHELQHLCKTLAVGVQGSAKPAELAASGTAIPAAA